MGNGVLVLLQVSTWHIEEEEQEEGEGCIELNYQMVSDTTQQQNIVSRSEKGRETMLLSCTIPFKVRETRFEILLCNQCTVKS